MNYVPRAPVLPCPNCNGCPDVQYRGIFFQRARLSCQCGVSGAWVDMGGEYGNPFNVASSGWEAVVGAWGVSGRSPKMLHADTPPPAKK